MGRMGNMERLEPIVGRLPAAERVDIAEWGDHPTFRVNGKNFVFSDQQATNLSLKLPKDEAAAVVASDAHADPSGYGLGRHGWISLTLDDAAHDSVDDALDDDYWAQIEE